MWPTYKPCENYSRGTLPNTYIGEKKLCNYHHDARLCQTFPSSAEKRRFCSQPMVARGSTFLQARLISALFHNTINRWKTSWVTTVNITEKAWWVTTTVNNLRSGLWLVLISNTEDNTFAYFWCLYSGKKQWEQTLSAESAYSLWPLSIMR